MSLKIPERIETDRLILRRLKSEQAEQIFYVYANKPEATRFVSWPTHKTIEDTRSYLRFTHNGWKKGIEFSFGIFLKKSDRLVGSIGMVNDQGKIQIGYVVGPVHWGNGYATESCKALVEILKQTEGVYRVGTFVDAENLISTKVLKKCGFIEEARLNKWFRFVNQNNEPKDCILFRLEI